MALTRPRSPDAPTAPAAALTTEREPRGRAFYRTAAQLIAQAADALEHAHSLGIVHRDVKPANLLVDTAGKLYVSDFGLARVGPDAGLTASGDLLGTLRYMAPEQALAKHGLVDHRADIYALGATLNELLTGRPAVDAAERAEILRKIAFDEPVSPRTLDKRIPVELETIALKCLAKNPAERYATAGELADDLRRFAEDRPIRARRPTARQRLARWGRRHPGMAASLGLTAGLLLAGAWAWHRETTQAEAAARTVAAEADKLREADRLPEALQAAQRANDLLPRFGGDRASRREIEARVADLHLLNRLEEVRLEATAEKVDTAGFEFELQANLFRQAFLDYGVDVTAGDEAAVVAALSRPTVAAPASAALAEWHRHAGADAALKERLARLAGALDSDPRHLLSRMRVAYKAKDVGALKRLASEARIDPPPPALLVKLTLILKSLSLSGEAEQLLRAGYERYPADFWINFHLATILTQPSQRQEAIGFMRAALALRPTSRSIWICLGRALNQMNRLAEAAAAYRRAIELWPINDSAHNNLGSILIRQGNVAEAEAEFREAIRLNPNNAEAHSNLAAFLSIHRGLHAEAEAEARKALALQPELPAAHLNLGAAYASQGRFADAETAFRQAIRDKPELPEAHYDLGRVLVALDRLGESASECQSAVALRPNYAEAHWQLGLVMVRLGRFADGAAELRVGHDLGRKREDWPRPFDQWVRDAERVAALAPRLPALLSGEAKPADASEQLALARMCLLGKRTAAAARFYAGAFAADPQLADAGDRYNAACVAALAGCGQGQDAAALDDAERFRLRRQALDWLNADLAAWAKVADNPADHNKLRQEIQHWRRDSDFTGVRDDAGLAKLPADERADWQKLWADVADLLKRTEQPPPAAKLDKKP